MIRRTNGALAACLLIAAVVAVAPQVVAKPLSPPPGTIAFASDRLAPRFLDPGLDCLSAHCSDIYVVNTDGTGLTRLTPGWLTGFQGSPTWSPDGTRIAFYRTFKGFQGQPSHQIYEMNADGSDITQITSGNQLSVIPAWSPDGTKIAFVRRPQPITYGHIAVMNPDGTDVVEITSGSNFDFRPTWSPDSSRIAFDRDCGIYVVNRSGTGLSLLVSQPGCVGDPAWSSDGKTISFWNFDLNALQAVDVRSNQVRTIATGEQLGSDPTAERLSNWSPDGKWLAVGACCDVGGVGMVLVSADGRTVLQVPNGEVAMAPAWQPS